jgi:hypothetical protein
MPNDAKLGLAAGLCIVVAVAVVYFRKDVATPGEPAAAVQSPGAARVVKGKTTSHPPAEETPRSHAPPGNASPEAPPRE